MRKILARGSAKWGALVFAGALFLAFPALCNASCRATVTAPSQNYACYGTVNFSANVTNTAKTSFAYQWSWNGGMSSFSGNSNSTSISTPIAFGLTDDKTQDVSLTADSRGCTATKHINLVDSTFSARCSNGADALKKNCLPTNAYVTFGANENAAAYQWSVDGKQFSTSKTPTYGPLAPGTYQIKLVVTMGGVPCETVKQITVDPYPAKRCYADLLISDYGSNSNSSVCSSNSQPVGMTARVLANGKAPYTFNWTVDGGNPGSGSSGKIANASFPFQITFPFSLASGWHAVSVNITDADGKTCSVSRNLNVINPVFKSSCGAGSSVVADGSGDLYCQKNGTINSSSPYFGTNSYYYQWYKSSSATVNFSGASSAVGGSASFTNDNLKRIGLKVDEKKGGDDGETLRDHDYPVAFPSGLQTHKIIWEPGKVTYQSFMGSEATKNLAATPYYETVQTEDVPAAPDPAKKGYQLVAFDLYPYSNNCSNESVTIKSFKFEPYGGGKLDLNSLPNAYDYKEYTGNQVFSWQGYQWDIRNGDKGDPGVGNWTTGSVVHNADDSVTLKACTSGKNSAEYYSQKADFGYGTYTSVVDNFNFKTDATFEGMFIYVVNPESKQENPCTELHANEVWHYFESDKSLGSLFIDHRTSWYGCPLSTCTDTQGVTSTVAACNATFNYSCPGGSCTYGKSFSLTANQTGAKHYKWYDGSTLIGTDAQATSAVINGTAAGNHTIRLEVDMGDGGAPCTFSKVISFSTPASCVVKPTPATTDCVYSAADSAYHCKYDSAIHFTATAVSGTPQTYAWTLDAVTPFGNKQTVEYTFASKDGKQHTVSLTAADVSGSCNFSSITLKFDRSLPVWDETVPGSMLLYPLGLALWHLARAVIFRL
jgi:hypothetical protein